jgi:predicted Rdx family selenoprotein
MVSTLQNESKLPEGSTHPERWKGANLVWDRKIEGRFPEMKELKQRVRGLIAPQQDLGHSDKATSRH